MSKYTDDEKTYTTSDIAKLGISRELNSKYEREGFLPHASKERAAGPWRAALYTEGDLIARVMMKRLTSRGLSLKATSWILHNARFIGEAFDQGELDEFKYMAFPVVERDQFNPKADPGSQPFNRWAELDKLYKQSEHAAYIVLDLEQIRKEVKLVR